MGIAITGGTVVTLDPPSVERRDILLGAEPRRSLDASGCLVLPGLAIAHTHLYSGLARGMPDPVQPTRSFREILERVWWRLDAALDERSLKASAEVALLDAALCGATAVLDHHESPSFIGGSLDVLAGAARAVGVRAALCYGATDRHGPEGAKAGLAECERAIAAGLPAMAGLHAGFTASDETIEAAADLARRRGAWLHVHAAEDGCDAGSFERLERAGAVGPKTILAHGVHLTASERERAAEAGAWIVHNPRSNLQNAVGYANVATLGPRVALGTDGMDGDLFAEARAAHLRGRDAYGPQGGIDAVALVAGKRTPGRERRLGRAPKTGSSSTTTRLHPSRRRTSRDTSSSAWAPATCATSSPAASSSWRNASPRAWTSAKSARAAARKRRGSGRGCRERAPSAAALRPRAARRGGVPRGRRLRPAGAEDLPGLPGRRPLRFLPRPPRVDARRPGRRARTRSSRRTSCSRTSAGGRDPGAEDRAGQRPAVDPAPLHRLPRPSATTSSGRRSCLVEESLREYAKARLARRDPGRALRHPAGRSATSSSTCPSATT